MKKWKTRNERDRNGVVGTGVERNFINNASDEIGSHREGYVLIIIPNGATER